tara:strand:+ start:6712 stop:7917 length:1206 start_codon:yes stop_codon:yes gene_type:complete
MEESIDTYGTFIGGIGEESGIGMGAKLTDEVWVNKTVNHLVGTLADNNVIIDEMLRRSHDIISHQGRGLRIEPDDIGEGVDDDRYYNADANSLKSVKSNLCNNNKSVCVDELATWSGMEMLSIIPRVFTFHILIIIICIIVLIVFFVATKILEAIDYFDKFMESETERKKRLETAAAEVNADEKDKYTWIAIFKYIVGTMMWINCGLGPPNVMQILLYIYGIGLLIWAINHLMIWISGMWSWAEGGPIVVTEFAPNHAQPGRDPGILYFLRFPIISKDYLHFLSTAWIVTPMAAHDNGIICKNGFEPSSEGDATIREKVSYEDASGNYDWCITGGPCPFGGVASNDIHDYNEHNKKSSLKYNDVGDIKASFEIRCQPMKNFGQDAQKDATEFANDALKKVA